MKKRIIFICLLFLCLVSCEKEETEVLDTIPGTTLKESDINHHKPSKEEFEQMVLSHQYRETSCKCLKRSKVYYYTGYLNSACHLRFQPQNVIKTYKPEGSEAYVSWSYDEDSATLIMDNYTYPLIHFSEDYIIFEKRDKGISLDYTRTVWKVID